MQRNASSFWGRAALAAPIVALLGLSAAAGTERQQLQPSDGGDADRFGWSVAMDGDLAVVGAPDNAGGFGAAYVYARCKGVWTEQVKLVSSGGALDASFGSAVTLYGNTIAVTSYGDTDNGHFSGTVHLFTLGMDGSWTEGTKFTTPFGEALDDFGASIALEGGTLAIGAPFSGALAQDGGTAYVYERDDTGTWSFQGQVTSADVATEDLFGISVALSGDTLAVGASGDDDDGQESGSVYVYTRDSAGDWTQQEKLTAGDGDAGDSFGGSVCLDGDTVLIGSDGDDDAGEAAGAAYAFTRDMAGDWTLREKLLATGGAQGDRFGASVALRGAYALCGAPNDDGNGSAYLFMRDGTGDWAQTEKLTATGASAGDMIGIDVALDHGVALLGSRALDASGDTGVAFAYSLVTRLIASDGAASDVFGEAVAIDGDTVAIGASRDDSAGAFEAGAVYVYERSADGIWREKAEFFASDPEEFGFFGHAVALEGDTIVAGSRDGVAYLFERDADGNWSAPLELRPDDNQSIGWDVALHGDILVAGAPTGRVGSEFPGLVYVFSRDAQGTWSQDTFFTGSDSATSGSFGQAVALHRDTLVVGAPNDDDFGDQSGAAFVFTRGANGDWSEQDKLTPSDGAAGDRFGGAVAVYGDTAIVGANQDGEAVDHGSAYVFTRDANGDWTQQTKLLATTAPDRDFFGSSVALGDDVALVGSLFDDFGGTNTGTVYAFTRDGAGNWSLFERFTPQPGEFNDRFGVSVDLDGSNLIVGADRVEGVEDTTGAAFVHPHVLPEPALELAPFPFPTRTTATVPFHDQLRAIGRAASPLWFVSQGSLPITGGLDLRTGRIDGEWIDDPNWHQFTIRAVTPCGEMAERQHTVLINRTPVLWTTEVPLAVQDRPYETWFQATLGTGDLDLTVSSGAIVDGLVLDQNHYLTGRPTEAGRFPFGLVCTDDAGASTAEAPFVLNVASVLDVQTRRHREDIVVDPADGGAPIYRALEVVDGTKLNLTLRFPTKGPPVALSFLNPRGHAHNAPRIRVRKKGRVVKVRNYYLQETGRWMIVLTPDPGFGGTVRFDCKVTPPTIGGGHGNATGQDPLVDTFLTLPGATAKITVHGRSKDPDLPTIESVKDEAGNELLVADNVKKTKKGAVLRIKDPLPGGEITVTFGTRGGERSFFHWRAIIKNIKGYDFSLPDVPADY